MKFTLKSKTHILGSLIGASGALLTALPTLQEYIPVEAYGYTFLVLSVVTVVLRNLTDTSIDQK